MLFKWVITFIATMGVIGVWECVWYLTELKTELKRFKNENEQNP